MACRECKWWYFDRRLEIGGKNFAECLFPVPAWVRRDPSDQDMSEDGGSGCPQFREREDEK